MLCPSFFFLSLIDRAKKEELGSEEESEDGMPLMHRITIKDSPDLIRLSSATSSRTIDVMEPNRGNTNKQTKQTNKAPTRGIRRREKDSNWNAELRSGSREEEEEEEEVEEDDDETEDRTSRDYSESMKIGSACYLLLPKASLVDLGAEDEDDERRVSAVKASPAMTSMGMMTDRPTLGRMTSLARKTPVEMRTREIPKIVVVPNSEEQVQHFH